MLRSTQTSLTSHTRLSDRAWELRATVKAQPCVKTVSRTGFVYAVYLRKLVCAHVFGARYQSVSSLSDEGIKDKLESLARTKKSVFSEEALADVKRHIKPDACKFDVRLCILMLQTLYVELCERLGWKFIATAVEVLVKQIIEILQPPSLKAAVEDAPKLKEPDFKNDFLSSRIFFGWRCSYLWTYLTSSRAPQPAKVSESNQWRDKCSENASFHLKQKFFFWLLYAFKATEGRKNCLNARTRIAMSFAKSKIVHTSLGRSGKSWKRLTAT